MFRTMISDTPFEQRWILQGRLCGQWAIDFEKRWLETRNARQGRRCVVDLEDITCIDSIGEGALQQIVSDGCEVVASRAYMKHVLKTVMETVNHSRQG
jgi:hypothetical protein